MRDKDLLIDLALKVATVDSTVLKELQWQVAKCQNIDTGDDPPFEYLWKSTQQIANAARTICIAVEELQHRVGVRHSYEAHVTDPKLVEQLSNARERIEASLRYGADPDLITALLILVEVVLGGGRSPRAIQEHLHGASTAAIVDAVKILVGEANQ